MQTMLKVNVLYADDFEDVDIILVPGYIANNIEIITQKFFNWVSNLKDQEQLPNIFYSDKKCISIVTKDFIWWLNNCELCSEPYATIIEEHTNFCPEYPTALF